MLLTMYHSSLQGGPCTVETLLKALTAEEVAGALVSTATITLRILGPDNEAKG